MIGILLESPLLCIGGVRRRADSVGMGRTGASRQSIAAEFYAAFQRLYPMNFRLFKANGGSICDSILV